MKIFLLSAFAALLAVQLVHADADRCNYILGPHTIGAHYQFTDQTRLLETAHVNIDYVSCSAYDAQKKPEEMLPVALDFIERHLPEKSGISGKRVWIGEFGYKAKENTPEQQKIRSLEFAQRAIEWGCPFVLHWQLYDNEFENGEYKGFWLIDHHGEKQPLYNALEQYYAEMRAYLMQRERETGSVPALKTFTAKAGDALERAKRSK